MSKFKLGQTVYGSYGSSLFAYTIMKIVKAETETAEGSVGEILYGNTNVLAFEHLLSENTLFSTPEEALTA